MAPRHKVFVSYYHANDQGYRDQFERLMSDHYDIMVSKSVNPYEIDDNLQTETIRQKIRDEYLRDSSVTVVLIGTDTWKRKYVDWEIGSSIRDTAYNSRSGLLGIFLPSFPFSGNSFDQYKIPPRLYDNWKNENRRYADLYRWNTNPSEVSQWIHNAFLKRQSINPDNSYQTYRNNRSGNSWQY
jgi:Thoeris protein ThsB, TIR-like domain